MLSAKLLVNSRQIGLGGVKVTHRFTTAQGVGTLNPCVVQGSTVLEIKGNKTARV